MTSRLSLHATPASSFDEPFEMLLECHQRVEHMLTLLARLGAHLPVHGADEQARQAACDVMRYFDQAGPAHHEDEERHLLPVLAQSGEPELRALATRLHDEHETMLGQWFSLRNDLQAIADGRVDQALAAAAAARRDTFAALYRNHIEVEESAAYPAARSRLDAGSQAAMGREMAGRRGVH